MKWIESKNKLFPGIKKIKSMPKKLLVKKIMRKSKTLIYRKTQKIYDYYFSGITRIDSYHKHLLSLPINLSDLDFSGIEKKTAQELWKMYKNHKFDLLGSGWVSYGYSCNSPGFEGYHYDEIVLETDSNGVFLNQILDKHNLKKSKKVWQLIQHPYAGIDWQKDIKSGYRWNIKEWYYPIRWAKLPGADIKIPWELARLQHLPRLSILYYILPNDRKEILCEFRNQILDFIAQNPIRMGVNYMCTMDVAIRSANLALAYTLFKIQNITFDDEFEQILCQELYLYCNHIFQNLEWSDYYTNNHYFADLVGLLYTSSILPISKKQQKWLNYSIKGIKEEILKQFHSDGTNKEGSTAYHRLTSEMAAYAIALIKRLGKDDGKSDVLLYYATHFLKDITRPDNLISAIGDNDSGVFFRLSITGEVKSTDTVINTYQNLKHYHFSKDDTFYLDEEPNDANPTISAMAALFIGKSFLKSVKRYPLEYSLISSILKDNKVKVISNKREKREEREKIKVDLNHFKYRYEDNISSDGVILTDKIKTYTYDDFGIYIFKSKNLYLLFNATTNGQAGNGGHAHNDKMSFELFIKDNSIIEDPGTYVYTASEDLRNAYRSVQAHNTIQVGEEQNSFTGMFSMNSYTSCKLLKLTEKSIIAQVKFKEIHHIREIIIEDTSLIIRDYCNHEFVCSQKAVHRTRGYGKLLTRG